MKWLDDIGQVLPSSLINCGWEWRVDNFMVQSLSTAEARLVDQKLEYGQDR